MTQQMEPLEVLKYFEGRLDQTIGAMRELVEIESPSFDAEGSRRVVDWIAREVESIGGDIRVERITAEGCGEHTIIRAFPGGAKPTLLLGHTDTVHPVGTKLKNPTRIENGKFFGCGIFDMKAGVVLILEALRFLVVHKLQPPSPLTVLLSCDEEAGSATGREIVEREARAAGRCLVVEPSAAGRVKTARKGTGIFTLKAHGIAAHAGLEPDRGASAILELARQIESLHTLGRPELGTTVNVCTVKGGTVTNVIPEHAECSVDVRFSTADEARRVEAAIRELGAVDARVSLEVTGEVNRPPLERTTDGVVLFENARAAAASFGYDLGETQVGGASDGNFVAALGVPVLDGLGVTGDGAHRLDEYILVDDIAKRATLLTLLLMSDETIAAGV
jgi:glutamate carboxypeptidase